MKTPLHHIDLRRLLTAGVALAACTGLTVAAAENDTVIIAASPR